ncbi:metal-dependent hydrolase [Arthrobacter sp. UM1]|uniref:metal-dependent hydrolase n=1 Tax=Arthrobacter sp. UM1 TaxID=2766776 RepID=UPI001CF71C3A|nr:metal-dependent hydrolase [Arthrobacter sp. UM1]MCB4208709.1 metal-dependent hydrolase [Arthrobacter sp. UM1]
MMGGHHAASGAAAWIALSTAGTGLALLPAHPAGVLSGALVCAGAALLPDLDHRSSTLTRALPPFTTVAARAAEAAAGGHRQGTHSVAGLAAVVFLAVLAGRTPWAPEVCALLLGALALGALKVVPGPRTAWCAALLLGLGVSLGHPGNPAWFPVAVGVGVAAHILGDLLTRGGVGLLWPFSSRRIALPLLGKTGSWVEWLVMTPVSLYAVFGLLKAGWETVQGLVPG